MSCDRADLAEAAAQEFGPETGVLLLDRDQWAEAYDVYAVHTRAAIVMLSFTKEETISRLRAMADDPDGVQDLAKAITCGRDFMDDLAQPVRAAVNRFCVAAAAILVAKPD